VEPWIAVEQPEATEPSAATASPDETEWSNAAPHPEATEPPGAVAQPDATESGLAEAEPDTGPGRVAEASPAGTVDPALTADSVVRGPFGPTTATEALTMRVVDIWVHEQDIRAAIGRPGNLDSPSAAAFVSAIIRSLPRIVARDAAVPVGEAVLFDITGPVVGRAGVRVVEGEDGRPQGEALFTGDTRDSSTDGLGGTTSIILSTDALTRRAAGRRAVDEIIFTVHGDEALARSVLERLVIMP